MIIREIKQNPELIDNFDFFNDYDDTKRWATRNCPELVPKLNAGFKNYLAQLKHNRWLKINS